MNDGTSILMVGAFATLGIALLVQRYKHRKLHNSENSQRDMATKIEHAIHVVSEFGRIMESRSSAPLCLYSEGDLPFPKKEIRESIELLMLSPLDSTQRNHLEVGNIFLNDFIPDEEYCAIQDQQGALGRVMGLVKAGDRDGQTLAKLLVDSETPASRLVLRQINERVNRDNEKTLARNQTLRTAALALATNKNK